MRRQENSAGRNTKKTDTFGRQEHERTETFGKQTTKKTGTFGRQEH
jgi:hypothetical protein